MIFKVMNDFDKILRQKLQGYTETPPPEAFENISKNFPKRTFTEVLSAYKYQLVAAVATIGILTAVIIAVIPSDNEQKNNPIQPAAEQASNIIPNIPEANESAPTTNTSTNATSTSNLTFIAESPKPSKQSENKICTLNFNDTVICGDELIIESLDIANIKESEGLILTKVASGVKLNSKTYGKHKLVMSNGRTVSVTFAKQEKIIAKIQKANLCYGEHLIVDISDNDKQLSWNDTYYSVKNINAGKYELSGLRSGSNNIVITTGTGGCDSKVTFDINMSDKLKYSVTTVDNYCAGSNGELLVNADKSLLNYCKLNGQTISNNGTFSGLKAGIYMVEINYANSCVAYDTVLVRDNTYLNAFFESKKDAFNEKRYTFHNYTRLDDSGKTENVDFEWLVNGIAITTDYNFDYEFKNNGKYVVELVARTGECESRYSETIGVMSSNFKIPNIFTPNGDGIGDEFTISYNGVLSNYDLSIYTKSGQLVFHTQQPDRYWDGKISGNNEASEGVYFYVVTATDENGENISQKGTVQLLR